MGATVATAVALALGAVAAGIMLGAAVSGEPLLDTLPPESYVRAKQFVMRRLDPLMPALMLASVLVRAVAGLLSPGTRVRIALGCGLLAAVSVVLVSLTVNVPINRWVARLDPAALPADFAAVDPRRRWRRAHLVRTGLALAAVAADAVAVTLAT